MNSLKAEQDMQTRIIHWLQTAEMARAYDDIGDSTNYITKKSAKSKSSVGSQAKLKQFEALANRRALEAKFKALE